MNTIQPPSIALVLAGGNALGAYHAGVWRALEDEGVIPGWVAGVSMGAAMAALIAGSPPGRRADALDRFWAQASAFDAATYLPPLLRQPLQYGQAVASRLLGRPPLFNLRPPDVSGSEARPGIFDTSPMRRLLTEMVDLHSLNDGAIRLSVAAIDLATGQEVVWDTSRQRLEIDHIMASAALIPDFQPVSIAGRLFVDGGLAANLPLHLVLEQALAERSPAPLTCFAADLFPLAAPLPRGLLQAAQRQSDLIFASQTRRTLAASSAAWAGREPGAQLCLAAYHALEEETAIKGFDFSSGSVERRRTAGLRDMQQLLRAWRAGGQTQPGLSVIHAAPEGGPASF